MCNTVLEKWNIVAKYRAIIGAMLVNLTLGIPYYYGNMASYTNSYFRFALGPNVSNTGPEWMLSSFLIALGIGVLITGYVVKKIGGLRRTTFLISIVFNSGVGCTYFSVQHSVELTIVTLMVVPGIMAGLSVSIGLMVAKGWFIGHRYLATIMSVFSSSFGLGGLIFNQLVTTFINPDKESPDYSEDNIVYFSQQEILERVPYVFFPILIVSAFFQISGILLLKDPPPNETDGSMVVEHNSEINAEENENTSSIHRRTDTIVMNTKQCKDELEKSNGFTPKNKGYYSGFVTLSSSNYRTYQSDQNNLVISREEYVITHAKNERIVTNAESEQTSTTKDKSPKEMLQTLDFYLLWMVTFSATFNFLVVNNYYKTFGEIWIRDDDFFSALGTISIITSLFCRILCGVSVDALGIKLTTLIMFSLGSIMTVFWYSIVQTGEVIYFLWTIILAGLYSIIFTLTPVSAVMKFGHEYYCYNFGVLNTSCMAACGIGPPLFVLFLSFDDYGWFWMFLASSLLTVVVAVLVWIFMSRD